MRILYGVTGEGMGHATRSKVILTYLASKGHDIKIVVSGRAHAYLTRYFPDVEEIVGLEIAYGDNAVKRRGTAWKLLKKLPDVAGNLQTYERIADAFKPDVVVSDFESTSYYFGKYAEVPVISIDNMQVLNRCELDVEIPKKEQGDFKLAKAVVKAKLPGCFHYLVTSFFFPKVRKKNTSLYPPILRDEILAAKASDGDHILVYQTSTSNTELIPVLQGMKEHRFFVYGLRRDEDLGNVQLRDFSETRFVDDLASCRAVIAGGGFSLMGEAVYLGKPMFSVPVRHQFEQTLNALYLEKYGYGEHHRSLSPDAITAFLGRVDEYARNLRGHRQDGNTRIFAALNWLLTGLAEQAGKRP